MNDQTLELLRLQTMLVENTTSIYKLIKEIRTLSLILFGIEVIALIQSAINLLSP